MPGCDWKCPTCGWEIRDTYNNAELGYLVSDHQTNCARVRGTGKPPSGSGCLIQLLPPAAVATALISLWRSR